MKHPQAVVNGSFPNSGAGAPEITTQMLKAGIIALRNWISADPERYSGSDGLIVRDVFLAMSRLLPGKEGEQNRPEAA